MNQRLFHDTGGTKPFSGWRPFDPGLYGRPGFAPEAKSTWLGGRVMHECQATRAPAA
jgi:hypothetical protein